MEISSRNGQVRFEKDSLGESHEAAMPFGPVFVFFGFRKGNMRLSGWNRRRPG